MFFYMSKLIWFFIQPSNLLLILFISGLIFYSKGWRKTAIRVLSLSVALFALAGLSPLNHMMMLTLEEQHVKPRMEELDSPAGFIVLGGMIDTLVSGARREMTLNHAAERLTEAARLAYRYPDAKIVISGGVGAILYAGSDEASAAKQFFTDIGIAPDRILIETESRNTWQNAVYTKSLLKPQAGEQWLLITSAFHMPRSMGVFRAADFEVTPWPVDYRTRGMEDMWRFTIQPSKALRNIDIAAKEWVGYLAYSMTGRLE